MPTSPSSPFVPPEDAPFRNQPATPRLAGSPPLGPVGGLAAHLRESPPLLHPGSGVADLMRAVLEDALSCCKPGAGSTTQTRRLAHETQAWFHSEDERGPFAFVNVCRALGLDPASVRRTLQPGHGQAPLRPYRKTRKVASRRQPLSVA